MQVACCFRQRVVCIFRAQHCRRQVQILANSREPQSRDVSGDSRAAGQRNTGNCSTDSSTVRGVARFSFTCPACSQRIHRLSILQRHLHNCCPDLVPAQVTVHFNTDLALHTGYSEATFQAMLTEAMRL